MMNYYSIDYSLLVEQVVNQKQRESNMAIVLLFPVDSSEKLSTTQFVRHVAIIGGTSIVVISR